MKKWLTRCALAATLIGIVLLVMVSQYHPSGIWMGQALQPGKVTPQLVNAGDTAVLLAPDGSLWAWGGTIFSNMSVLPQPAVSQVPLRVGSDTDWMGVSCGLNTLAIKNDGSLWTWGWKDPTGPENLTNHYDCPTRIGSETNWTQICTCFGHNLALKNDGSLWAWGGNVQGVLDNGSTYNPFTPTLIRSGLDWRSIVAQFFSGFALKSNGTIWGWQQGAVSNNLTPRQIMPGSNWMAISAYGPTFLALQTDGTL